MANDKEIIENIMVDVCREMGGDVEDEVTEEREKKKVCKIKGEKSFSWKSS